MSIYLTQLLWFYTDGSADIQLWYLCKIYQLSRCTVYYCCILSLSLFTFRSYLSYYISWLAFGIDHKDLVLLCILSNPLRYGAAFTIWTWVERLSQSHCRSAWRSSNSILKDLQWQSFHWGQSLWALQVILKWNWHHNTRWCFEHS